MAGKKIMMVIPPRDFDGKVFETMRRMLISRGHRVETASIVSGTATADDGTSFPVGVRIYDINTWEWDGYVFIGGEGTKLYYDNDRVKQLAKDVKYKPLAVTGNAVVILALSELVKEKKVTCPTDVAGWVIGQGAVFTNRPYEVEEKMFTLQEPNAVEEFTNAFMASVEGQP